jgi:hypothetical protein
MVRYFLKEEFREKIFKKAVDKEGSEAYLGRKLVHKERWVQIQGVTERGKKH